MQHRLEVGPLAQLGNSDVNHADPGVELALPVAVGFRSYFGGPSLRNAAFTVFRDRPACRSPPLSPGLGPTQVIGGGYSNAKAFRRGIATAASSSDDVRCGPWGRASTDGK